jgi:hypothetical protein
VVMLPGVGSSPGFFGLPMPGFDGESAGASSGAPPRPMVSIESRPQAAAQRGGLDTWLIDNFFGRR